VQCLVDNDCGGGGQLQCDEPAHECRGLCGSGGGVAICNGIGGVCSPDDDLCVGCVDDGDCDAAAGETCDTVTRNCVAPPPADTLCLACDVDTDCGGTNQCVRIQRAQNPQNVETACGIDCSDGSTCPQGFGCEFVTDGDGVVVGQQCVPANSVVEFPTCDAYRDTIAAAQCFVQFGAACGFDGQGAGDGVCFPPDDTANQGVCTLPCGVDADCPAAFTCEVVTVPDFPVEKACVPQ
jgi:hypothetical protein